MNRTRKPGAGRKSNASKGIENAVTRSFSIPPDSAAALDALHGDQPLGQWLVKRLRLGKSRQTPQNKGT